ncbi:hypothetical protein HYH03_017935 [Edaphochlamys debaryana]|uniref:SSD domain-containing protein n=1 Tax=Edaphochlamys debaryana TaxID=47281 RepID=A0A835XLG4_9CHLO|nr:hypothetical protein HYH03_017935 [Edaphochlamys debaryana]|eukprot:KAG2483200.1 hypothetical protein HYH03_017935 [Edaphochlamys debaryana]
MSRPSSEGEETERRCECCTRVSRGYERGILKVQSHLNRGTGAIGAFAARRPWLVTWLSVLLAGACAAGWARFRIESDGEVLWVPQDSKAKHDEDWVKANYVGGGGYAQFLATVNPAYSGAYGSNALQLSIFSELFSVDSAVRALVVNDGGRSYTWNDVCEVNFNGTCKYTGPLNYWSMDYGTYLAAVNGSSTDITAGNRDVLIDTVNEHEFPDGSSVSTLSLFGGIVLSPLADPPEGSPPLYMSSAEVIAVGYSLRDGLDDSVTDKWYEKYLDTLKEWAKKTQYSSLAYIAGNSMDKEIERSVTNDLYLIVISILIFILVAVAFMSRWHRVGTRSSLALLGVLSAVLAMVAGYGLSMLFGCAFTTLSQVLPYVLLGVAIDCMFILTKAYENIVAADPTRPLESRLRKLMAGAGTSVVVTLLASAVAFALGSISELPSIQWFAVYATMSIVCILVATLTFFIGVFVLTERRIAANRVDCCCCVVSAGPPVPTAPRCHLEDPDTPVQAVVLSSPPVPAASPSRAAAGPGPVAEGTEERVPSGRHSFAPSESYASSTTLQAGMSGGDKANRKAVFDAIHSAPTSKAEGVDEPAVPPDALKIHVSSSDSSRKDRTSPKGAPLPETEVEQNLTKHLFAKYYAPALTKWYIKVLVILIFIGWAVLSGIGSSKLEEGQPMSELAPDDSYLQDYVKVMEDTFQEQVGSPTELYFRYFDPSPPVEQGRMLSSLALALDDDYTNATISAFQGNWLLEFIGWVQSDHPNVTLEAAPGCTNPYVGRVSGDLGLFVQPTQIRGCVPQAVFYQLLRPFLDIHKGYRDDLRWAYATAPGGAAMPTTVWSSRFPLVHTAQGDNGAYGRKCINSVRQVEDDINDHVLSAEDAAAPNYVAFMYNGDYIFAEGDAILGTMTVEYVLLAVAGVGLVLCLTLPSIRAVIYMMIAVGLVDFFLFGEMFILGIRFNQVSIINMIMATGLAVDYSVYFAQRFVDVQADGTLNGRMALALSDTGSSVFVGGITALCGTIPLAFSTSTILRTFFSLIFGTIAFALLIGLMLMPVVFSLVGPPPLHRDVEAAGAKPASKSAVGTGLQLGAPEPVQAGKGTDDDKV